MTPWSKAQLQNLVDHFTGGWAGPRANMRDSEKRQVINEYVTGEGNVLCYVRRVISVPTILFLMINLVNDQLDAQIFYFIILLLQSSACFEQRRAHHQEVKFY